MSEIDRHPELTDDDVELFEGHFARFPWESLPEEPVGFELACGTGKWASLVAGRVGRLHCVDPGPACLAEAERHLGGLGRCTFHEARLDDLPFEDGTMSFGYCLGSLGPDRESVSRALAEAARVLEPSAPFLLYLLYALDNRPLWFRGLWLLSDLLRRAVAAGPPQLTRLLADGIAAAGYLPLARAAGLAERAGLPVASIPLSPYRAASFQTMRAAALERFGRKSEPRYAAGEVRALMEAAGLESVRVSDRLPYWTALGLKPSR